MPIDITKDCEQQFVDQNQSLIEICEAVSSDIFLAERALEIAIWIGENAEQINSASYGRSFGIWQNMAVTEMTVAFGKVFEKRRDCTGLSKIIRLMTGRSLIDRDSLESYLISNCESFKKDSELEDAELVSEASKLIRTNYDNLRATSQLQQIISFRNNEVAHRKSECSRLRPTFIDVSDALNWAKSFVGMVGKTFSNSIFEFSDGEFRWDYEVKASIASMNRLASDLGVSTASTASQSNAKV